MGKVDSTQEQTDSVSRNGNPEKEPKKPPTAGDQTVTETDCFGRFLSTLGMAGGSISRFLEN